jgi:nudix-type nucleoside diphosphatase (YffH/AdpP family)
MLRLPRSSKQLVLVNQFKAPTLGKGHANGWITETVAGMVDRYETPAAAAARETLEETGYKIGGLTEIATFFSSPGGSSERIFLYYSEVGEADQLGKGGGDADEDIEVQHIPVHELLEQLQHKSLEDPKLIISALWLKEELNKQAQRPLDHVTVKYALAQHPDLFIGYKTGPIVEVKDVSIWVNSENEDMIMDRFIGRSISANIRYLGADRDRSNNVTEDLINDELANAVGQLARVRIGEVIETGSGTLAATHGVKSILHVATVRGVGAGQGVKADLDDLALCTRNVLMKAHERNQRWRNIKRIFGMKDCRSILIPILGAGDGGLTPVLVAPSRPIQSN